MDSETLLARPKITRSAEHVCADEHAAVGPPEHDLVPGAAVLDRDAGERAERTSRDDVVADTEPSGEGRATAVVPVEQLDDARGCARSTDPFLDTVPVDGIDHPDAAVHDEGMRATLHELVDDPAEAIVELVAKPGPHSPELTDTTVYGHHS